mgnify:CR=1 FL=1
MSISQWDNLTGFLNKRARPGKIYRALQKAMRNKVKYTIKNAFLIVAHARRVQHPLGGPGSRRVEILVAGVYDGLDDGLDDGLGGGFYVLAGGCQIQPHKGAELGAAKPIAIVRREAALVLGEIHHLFVGLQAAAEVQPK